MVNSGVYLNAFHMDRFGIFELVEFCINNWVNWVDTIREFSEVLPFLIDNSYLMHQFIFDLIKGLTSTQFPSLNGINVFIYSLSSWKLNCNRNPYISTCPPFGNQFINSIKIEHEFLVVSIDKFVKHGAFEDRIVVRILYLILKHEKQPNYSEFIKTRSKRTIKYIINLLDEYSDLK